MACQSTPSWPFMSRTGPRSAPPDDANLGKGVLVDYLLTAGLTERLAAASSQSAGARSLAKPSPGLVESVKHEKSDLSVSGGAEEALPDEASVEAKLRRLEALLQGDDAGGTYHR